jgi:hypothetical protein
MAKKRKKWTPEERAEWEARYEESQRGLAERIAEIEAAQRPQEERQVYYRQRLADLERMAGLAPSN